MTVFAIGLHNLSKIRNPIWFPDNLKHAVSAKWSDVDNERAVVVSGMRNIP